MDSEAPAAAICADPAPILADWHGRQRAYLRARVLADGPKATALAMVRAMAEELRAAPGIGPALASAITKVLTSD